MAPLPVGHVEKPRKVDGPKKKKADILRMDARNHAKTGNPYQMEDNKNPKGTARSAAPWGGAEGAALLSPIR